MANLKISQLTEAITAADTDQIPIARGAGNRRMKLSTLRAINGLRGLWDVTGADAPGIPESSFGVTFSATASPEEYNATFPAGPIGLNRCAASAAAPLPATNGWIKFVVPASDPGDNAQGFAVAFANGGATAADIAASFNTFPALVGTCTFIALAFSSGGTQATYVIDTLGLQGVSINGAIAGGDTLYFGIDAVAGAFLSQTNGGAISSISYPLAGEYKAVFSGGFTSEPPVLLDSPVLFSLGTTDSGKTAFITAGDATPPVYPSGTLNGTRWLVQNSGRFNGKTLAEGDVAEFMNNATEVIVTPAVFLTTEDATAIAAAAVAAATPDIIAAIQADLGPETLFAEGVIADIINTPGAATQGKLYLLGTSPAGAFSSFAPGSMAVLTDAGWVNFTKARCLGRIFSIGSLLTGGWSLMLEDASGLTATTGDPYFHRYWNTVALGTDLETEISLRALGWVLVPARRSGKNLTREYAFAAVASGSIDQKTADYHDVNITDGVAGNFTLFMGVGGVPTTTCIVSVLNVGVGSVTLSIGSSSYLMVANQRRFFMAFGDALLSVQEHALLSP